MPIAGRAEVQQEPQGVKCGENNERKKKMKSVLKALSVLFAVAVVQAMAERRTPLGIQVL
jgi:CRISPR/Cas system-associated protein Cas7 (RAMP superfamily)